MRAFLVLSVVACGACTSSTPDQASGPVSRRPPGSLCKGFPHRRLGILCGSLEHFGSTELLLFPSWRYTETPQIEEVGAGRISFDGAAVASPGEDLGVLAYHYVFALPRGPLDLRHVATSFAGVGRTLTFEGKDRYATYHLTLSLRNVWGNRVQLRAHIDAAMHDAPFPGGP